jgi:ABC-type uncharacterized transport system auxiliary subunit
MNVRVSTLLLSIVVMATACSSLIVSSTAPPVYYQLQYTPAEVDCRAGFREGVRVWDFSTSSPFDRPDMIVLKENGEVFYSSSYQWVANPGTMVSQDLLRDLTLGTLFPQVVGGDSPLNVPLELTGRVFVFSWEKTGSEAKAALQIEMSLTHTEEPRKVIFRKEYDLKSKPFKEDTSTAFARAMSELVGEFSAKLRRDLCASRR